MKILRVISNMNPVVGGPCQGIRNSVPALAKLGVETEVVCLDDPTLPFLGKDPFIIHALGPAISPWRYSSKLIPWLKENLLRFDAVIVHGLWLYNSYAVNKTIQILSKQYKSEMNSVTLPKIYIMPHGMLDPYFQRATGRRLKAIRNWAYWKFIEGKVVQQADALLFTCEAELQLAKEPFQPYLPKQEINIGYGVKHPPVLTEQNANVFFTKHPDLKSQPYLLFLSRIHKKKGVDLLIQAYIQLLKLGKKLPKLVIAGPGIETQYGKKLLRMANENEAISSSIVFTGMLQGDEKWAAFYGCEAFILPSHQENFGIAVAEALACGAPVLITNQVNIWKEIEEEASGIVEEDSLDGTTQLITKWLNLTASEKKLMKEAAKKTFETRFSIEPAAQKLFKDVLLMDRCVSSI